MFCVHFGFQISRITDVRNSVARSRVESPLHKSVRLTISQEIQSWFVHLSDHSVTLNVRCACDVGSTSLGVMVAGFTACCSLCSLSKVAGDHFAKGPQS